LDFRSPVTADRAADAIETSGRFRASGCRRHRAVYNLIPAKLGDRHSTQRTHTGPVVTRSCSFDWCQAERSEISVAWWILLGSVRTLSWLPYFTLTNWPAE